MSEKNNIKYFKNSKLDVLKIISIIFFPIFSVITIFLAYKQYEENEYDAIVRFIPKYDSVYFLSLIILFIAVYFIIMSFIKYFPILITKNFIINIKARKRINAVLTILLSSFINIFISYNMIIILNHEKNIVKGFNNKIYDLIADNKYIEAYNSIEENKDIYKINDYDSIKGKAYLGIVTSIYDKISNINNTMEMDDINYSLIYNDLIPAYNLVLTSSLSENQLNLYSNKMHSLLLEVNDSRTNYFISLYKSNIEEYITNEKYLDAYNFINEDIYSNNVSINDKIKNDEYILILDSIIEKIESINKLEMNDTNYNIINKELIPIYNMVLNSSSFNDTLYSDNISDLLLEVNNNRTNYFISLYKSNVKKATDNAQYLNAYNYVKNTSYIRNVSIGEDIKKEEYKNILDSIFSKCIDINKAKMDDNNYYTIKQNIVPVYYTIVSMEMVKESKELYYTNISDILNTTENNRIIFLRNDFVEKCNSLINNKDYISLIDLLMKELDKQIYYEMDNEHYNFIYSRILDVYDKYIKEIDKKEREVYNNKFDSYCKNIDEKRHSYLENYMEKIKAMDKKEAESKLPDIYHYSKRGYISKFIFDTSYKKYWEDTVKEYKKSISQ